MTARVLVACEFSGTVRRAIAETRQAVAHLTAAATTLGWIAHSRAGAIELFTLARPEKSNGNPSHDQR